MSVGHLRVHFANFSKSSETVRLFGNVTSLQCSRTRLALSCVDKMPANISQLKIYSCHSQLSSSRHMTDSGVCFYCWIRQMELHRLRACRSMYRWLAWSWSVDRRRELCLRGVCVCVLNEVLSSERVGWRLVVLYGHCCCTEKLPRSTEHPPVLSHLSHLNTWHPLCQRQAVPSR